MRRRDFVIVLLGSTLLATREGRTQQQRLLGFLSAGSADAYAPFVAAFRSALSDAGYTEGRNLAIEFRWAEGHYDRLPELTADLVRSQVDVIVASGGDICDRRRESRDHGDPHCLQQRRRSGRKGVCLQSRPARREHDGRVAPRHRIGAEAGRVRMRIGSRPVSYTHLTLPTN